MSIPRRSARLAAIAAPKALSAVFDAPAAPTVPTNPPRICYDCTCNQEHVAIVQQYFKDIQTVRGRLGKSVLAICMLRFLEEHPALLTQTPRFQDMMQRKMMDFEREVIPDAELHQEFHRRVQAVQDLLVV
jgi:hypothetical protein